MKKTNFLIGMLSFALVSISVMTAVVFKNQKNLEKSIATQVIDNKSDNSVNPLFGHVAYLPSVGENSDFVYAAEKSVNAVVHIHTKIVTKGNSYYDFFGPLLEQIYGGRMQVPENVADGYGSGVVVSPDGYIVTNNHVVDGASSIEVTFNDKHKRQATLIGKDPSTDIALIKVDAKDLECLTFGDSDKVRVGEWVLAVGNPFNLTSTVTAGIVSAKARNINILGDGTIESFIQTDAAVNPGNSGGALVDMEGNLIGINAAIASRTGSYEGYSFAIPSNIAKKVVGDFLQFGALQRAYLGVTVTEVSEEIAEKEGLDVLSGVIVMGVENGGGAEKAGIKVGDIILSVNDLAVDTYSQLVGVVGQYRPGDVVKVKLSRGGDRFDKNVTLMNLHGNIDVLNNDDSFYNEALGIVLQPISPALQSKLGVNYGLKIVEVKDGIMKKKGISDDFVILTVNNVKVTSEKDLNKAITSGRNGKVRIEGTDTDGKWLTTYEFYRN